MAGPLISCRGGKEVGGPELDCPPIPGPIPCCDGGMKLGSGNCP
jgi:hypothetical protein